MKTLTLKWNFHLRLKKCQMQKSVLDSQRNNNWKKNYFEGVFLSISYINKIPQWRFEVDKRTAQNPEGFCKVGSSEYNTLTTFFLNRSIYISTFAITMFFPYTNLAIFTFFTDMKMHTFAAKMPPKN